MSDKLTNLDWLKVFDKEELQQFVSELLLACLEPNSKEKLEAIVNEWYESSLVISGNVMENFNAESKTSYCYYITVLSYVQSKFELSEIKAIKLLKNFEHSMSIEAKSKLSMFPGWWFYWNNILNGEMVVTLNNGQLDFEWVKVNLPSNRD